MVCGFVTFLFQIDNGKHTMERLLSNGRNLMKYLPNITIFCGEELYERVKEVCNDATVEVMNIKDFWPFKYHEEGRDQYTLLTWCKFAALERVIGSRRYSHYAWIDFGILHIARLIMNKGPYFYNVTEDKIRLCVIAGIDPKEVSDALTYYGANKMTTKFCGGGYITGGVMNMEILTGLFRAEVETIVGLGLKTNEETILMRIIIQNPNLFNPYYGQYCSILCNYHYARISIEFIYQTIFTLPREKACQIGEYVMESVDYVLKEEYTYLGEMIYQHYVNVYYAEGKDRARIIAQKYIELMERKIIVPRDIEFVRNNFKLVELIF